MRTTLLASNRKGLTLVDLLVVIVITAVLAAVLSPVFAQGKGKERSGQMGCLSNLKRIGRAQAVYCDDHDGYYQLDTGPVLFPDLSLGHEAMIGNLRLAYVAHNAPDWAEFLLNVPVSIADDMRVNHYAQPQRVDAVNTLYEGV